jgi:ATP-binding cassette subfamily C protein
MQKYTFKQIFSEIFRYKKELILANIIAMLAVLISLPIPLMVPYLIDEILLKKPSIMIETVNRFFAPPHEAYFYVVVILIASIVLRALFFLLNVAQNWYFTKISKNVTFKIQKDLLSHISQTALFEYENFGAGKISSLLVVDVATIDNFLGVTVSRFIISILTVLGIASMLLWLNWQLGLFILSITPIIAYVTKKIARNVGKLKKIENKKIAEFQEDLGENLDLFWQVKASNQEKVFVQNLTKQAEVMKETAINFKFKNEAAMLFSFFLFLAAFELFRSAGILSVEYGDLTIGMMLAIFGYLWVIMNPLQEIISIQYAYHNAQAALDRINAIFALKQEPIYPHHQNPFKETESNSIELKDLYFSYAEGSYSLEGINMRAARGEKIAIVGETGSGKTTLAQLLVGFYQPQSGDILFDGISYKEIGLDVIREHLFLVLQSPMLFNNTIRYNLTFGKVVEESLLQEAIEVAQLRSFIDSLEDGLDTIVGKNGVKLSGGQRQRLSIARMLVAKPNVVILDESTSSLDVKTEEVLFSSLSTFLKERTTIIIAHRLSTITQADYIYVLENGRIIEEGKYEALLAQNGTFKAYVNKGKK